MSLSAAHYSLGLEFHRNEQFAEAARCYGNVLKLEPQHADARKYLAVVEFNLGAEAQRNGDLTEAEARYRASLQADVDLLPPRHNLARVAQALMAEPGQSERAFSCFRTSLLLDDEQSAQIDPAHKPT